MKSEQTLNVKVAIFLIWAGLIGLWSIDSIDHYALIGIGSLVTFILIRVNRNNSETYTDKLSKANKVKKRKLKEGALSMRAQALNNIPTPIVIITGKHVVSFANLSALDVIAGDLENADIFLHLREQEIFNAIHQALDLRQDYEGTVRYKTPDGRSFDVFVRYLFKSAGIRNGRVILFFYEVTDLIKTDQMRVDFVANASHELRTPLSSVLGFIETLQGPAKDDPEAQERFLSIMYQESERMARLIEDLLSLSKIEMDRYTLPEETVELKGLIDNAAGTLKPLADKRGITIDLSLGQGLPAVVADADQVLQVLSNLISNAIKYATENSVVTVGVFPDSADAPKIKVFIRDQGPGIDAEHMVRLTERFYRVDTARSRQMGGTGLGLAIVKHILLRHQSALEITSTVGQGSCFCFQLTKAT